MVKLLNDYDPHVMLDLHTTDGSRYAYHLTWEVPNNPAVDPAILHGLARWLPAVASDSEEGWMGASPYGDVEGHPDRVWTVEDLPRYPQLLGCRNRWHPRKRIRTDISGARRHSCPLR